MWLLYRVEPFSVMVVVPSLESIFISLQRRSSSSPERYYSVICCLSFPGPPTSVKAALCPPPPSNARVHAFMDVLSTHRIVDFPHTMSQIHDTKKTTHCHSQERSVQFLLNFDNPPLTPTERNLQVQSTRTFEKYISWTLSTNSSSKNSKFGESF